jgi:hypothetical protein
MVELRPPLGYRIGRIARRNNRQWYSLTLAGPNSEFQSSQLERRMPSRMETFISGRI